MKSKTLSILSELTSFFKSNSITSFEKSNLTHDLAEVLLRLKAGQYKESDYISHNVFDVPRRTEEFFIYMKGYQRQAETWSDILQFLVNSETKLIMDLCPGWAPKVELALHRLDYKGSILLHDINNDSTQRIIDYMKLFKPSFKVEKSSTNIFSNKFKESSIKADIIVGNHIIDDLLLYNYSLSHDLSLSDLYGSEIELTKAISEIMRKKTFIKNNLAKDIASMVNDNLSPQGYIVISQYAGLFEKSKNLDEWVVFCKQIGELVKEKLLDFGYKDNFPVLQKAFKKSENKYFSKEDVFCLKKDTNN